MKPGSTSSNLNRTIVLYGLQRLSWLPIPLFLILIILLRLYGNPASIEAPYLLLSLNFIFSTLISFFVACLMGRSFVRKGDPGILIVGCGVLLWGSAGFIGPISSLIKIPGSFDANTTVTIHNTCASLSALLHLAGVASSIRLHHSLGKRFICMAAAYAATLAIVGLVTAATLSDLLPVFFIPGHGGTPVRQMVVASSMAMFLGTAYSLYRMNSKNDSFYRWYMLAMILLAEGMLGVMMQPSLGSSLTWIARGAQFFGGLYLLFAALTSTTGIRQERHIILDKTLDSNLLKYPIAATTVLGTACLRLVFFQELGPHAPYVTFLPAVILAALYGGVRAGLAATAISAFLAEYLFISTPWSFDLTMQNLSAMGIFILAGIMVSTITEAMLRARARVLAMEAEARFAAERADQTEKLQIAHERMRLTLLTSGLEAWSWDIDTDTFTRFLPNAAAEEAMGSVADYFASIDPADRDRVIAAVKRSAATGVDFEEEFRICRKDEKRWLLSRATLQQRSDGRPHQLTGINLDITDRKNMEWELVQAHEGLEQRVAERTAELAALVEELHAKELLLLQQSRLAAMGEMIQNIAHQWRQPLNSLGLNIQLLKMHYEAGRLDPLVANKSIENAMMLIRHMSGTIDDFRNFFKPDKEKVAFKVGEVISKAIELVEGSFRSRHIRIAMSCNNDPVSYGYPNQYSQVILNILNNARDAIEKHGPPEPMVTVAIESMNGRSRVSITDNGGGIKDDIIFKIFGPHFTTKGPQGTGIGLFMAKNIIERNMEGTMEVYNTGSGATFTIEV